MSMDGNNPLQIPSNLIKTNKLQGKDTLAEKHNFDLIGTNGYIEIDPAIVKFSGFEVGKINITKVRIINCSSKPQRVHILPPSTPYFTIKFNKKGQLAPGMSEDVMVHFTPNDYKYYYDCVRVHTGDEQLQIPIHAYPVMNRESNKEVFPKIIDFGTCPVGTMQSMTFPLVCKIPLNFEYEFAVKKEQNGIRINPSRGIVPGKGSMEIEIQFNCLNESTVVAEYELMISQFDFEPIKVKVMGAGKLKEKEKNQGDTVNGRSILNKKKTGKPDPLRMSAVDNMKGISEKTSETLTTFLNIKENEKPSAAPIVEEEASMYKTLIQTQKSRINEEISPTKKSSMAEPGTKAFNNTEMAISTRQILEKQFLERFNQVTALDKEKNIKFFQSIGDPHITREGEQEIQNERDENRTNFLNKYEHDNITRYEVALDQGLPVVGEVVPQNYSSYDMLKNDNIQKRRRILHRLSSCVSKEILKARLERRLSKIQTFLAGAKTRAEVKALVAQDWQRAEYFGIGKKDFVMFNFQFSVSNVRELKLPIQTDTSAASLSFKFELNQRIGFDDLAPIDPLPYSDLEVMGYTIVDPPMIINYPPIEANRKDRKGAEEEYSISGPTGPVEKVSETLELMEAVPSVLKKPFNIESHKFVCPHPKMKTLVEYLPIVETDPEYELQPARLDFQDSLDPNTQADYEPLYREFLSSAPGMDGIRGIAELPLEFTNYYTHKFNLTSDFGFEEKWEKMCPDLLDKAYEEDKFSDDDSDEEQSLNIEVPEVDQFLNTLEADDPKIKELKAKNEGDIWDENEWTLQTVNKNLENEKKLWCATLTTKIYDIDRNIVNKDKVLNLL